MKKLFFGLLIVLIFQNGLFGEELEWWEENYPLKSAPEFIQELNEMQIGQTMRVRLLVKIAPMAEMNQSYYSVFNQQLNGSEIICYYEIDRTHFIYNIILLYPSEDINSFNIRGIQTPVWDTSNFVLGFGFGNDGFREIFIRFDKTSDGLSCRMFSYRDVEVNDFMRITRVSTLIELDWDSYIREYGHTWE